MNAQQQKRIDSLLPGGVPKYIRCYDDPYSGDRYTVIFTKKRVNAGCYPFPHHRGQFWYIFMNSQPFHGIGMHGESDELIDRPRYRHLGKKVAWNSLPEDCKRLVIDTYKDIWNL